MCRKHSDYEFKDCISNGVLKVFHCQIKRRHAEVIFCISNGVLKVVFEQVSVEAVFIRLASPTEY